MSASDSTRTSSGLCPPVNCCSLKRSMLGSSEAWIHSHTFTRALSRTNNNMIWSSVGYALAPPTLMRALSLSTCPIKFNALPGETV